MFLNQRQITDNPIIYINSISTFLYKLHSLSLSGETNIFLGQQKSIWIDIKFFLLIWLIANLPAVQYDISKHAVLYLMFRYQQQLDEQLKILQSERAKIFNQVFKLESMYLAWKFLIFSTVFKFCRSVGSYVFRVKDFYF